MRKKVFYIFIVIILSSIAIFYILNKFDELENRTTNQNRQEENIEEDNGDIDTMFKINIIINDKTYVATLENSETTKEFIKMLPLEINMSELNKNEKFYYLENTLPTNQIRLNKIEKGDIMLYGNNCLVLFYKSHNTSYSYTKIGRIDNANDLEKELGKEDITIKFKVE